MYITSNIDSRLIKFEVRIQCYECTSYNCEHYIKEPDVDYGPSEDAITMPSRIIYRCRDCGSLVDKESG